MLRLQTMPLFHFRNKWPLPEMTLDRPEQAGPNRLEQARQTQGPATHICVPLLAPISRNRPLPVLYYGANWLFFADQLGGDVPTHSANRPDCGPMKPFDSNQINKDISLWEVCACSFI